MKTLRKIETHFIAGLVSLVVGFVWIIIVSTIGGSGLMTGGLLIAWCLGATLFVGGALGIVSACIRVMVMK